MNNVNKMTVLSISILCIFGLVANFAFADRVLFNGFESPLSGLTTIVYNGGGSSQIVALDTTYAYAGSQSLMWRHVGPWTGSTFMEWDIDYPSIQNWTGATCISVWQFWDFETTGSSWGWTIQFGIRDTTSGSHDLGNWQESSTGAYAPDWHPYHTWYKRNWPSPTGPADLSGIDLSAVDRLYCYDHPGDFGDSTTADGSLTIWIDDIMIEGPTITPQIIPSFASLRPGKSQLFSVSGTPGPYTWSLSTIGFGTLDSTTGSSVTFTAASTFGTLTLTVTDGDSLTSNATITVAPESAPLVEESPMLINDKTTIKRLDSELFE